MNLETIVSLRLDYAAFVALILFALLAVEFRVRRRHMSRGLGLSCWLVLSLILVSGAGVAEHLADRQRQQRRDMLMGYAPTYARELEALGHASLPVDAAPDDPLYLTLIAAEIRWLKVNPSVADIYTFRKQGDRIFLMVDSETDYDHSGAFDTVREARTPIGKDYQSSPGILRAFAGQPTFDGDPAVDEWGTWVSAYEPMFDAQGRVEAVLGVDYDAAAWTRAAFLARLSAMGAFALLISIVTSAAVVVSTQRAALDARTQIEADIREARDAAELANRSKSVFLANMSHEIRTPMTAILGFTDLLLDADPGNDHLLTIKRNGDHLLSIINDILDISKIEADKMSLESVPTDPARVLEEAVSLMRPRADAKGIALKIWFDTPIPRSFCSDPVRLRQILLNLIGNAVKFTDAGGVSVRIAFEPVSSDGARLSFEIKDTGIGISDQQAARLFQAFSQADPSTTRRFGGTGLGLAISRRLAEMLGGDITVKSTTGQGATFTFHIRVPDEDVDLIQPAELSQAPSMVATAVASAIQTRSLEGIRILLAEDGPDNQRLILHHLTRAGAHVTIVDNGRKAVDAMDAALDFDLILMDMQMPEMDGYAATAALRRKGHRIPIIALTAHAMAGDREKCRNAGCDDYTTKPVDRDALIDLCAKWVGQPVHAS